MANKETSAASGALPTSQKRKNVHNGSDNAGKGRVSKRLKIKDARCIITQAQDASFSKGELDLQAFIKTREFEIKAMEDGMRRSKCSLSTRAFQQVPRDMRRRTASHNVKRVPKRLQPRAGREMKEDNTPTVDPSKRKPRNTKARLRTETAKKLGILAAKKKQKEAQGKAVGKNDKERILNKVLRPKIRRNALNEPPKAKSKFRKRQIHKTWLPTHMWHAKRARMTEPSDPLWRFAIPLTSTEKSYRPTHRASGANGAVVWDTSYMSTIGLYGPLKCLENILREIGIVVPGSKGEKWRHGKRSWNGWINRNAEGRRIEVGPATVLWAAPTMVDKITGSSNSKDHRRLVIRIHPAAFLEIWTEIIRLSKIERPTVHVEDLRFEIGSIVITGPGSTETLLGILHPYDLSDAHAKTFESLRGVTNPASLPSDALLSFSIMDPRLHFPPRRVQLPSCLDEEANFALLQTLSSWPLDDSQASAAIFDRHSRFKATCLASQKALNRRKGLAAPGEYPSILPNDPAIPILLHTSSPMSSSAQGCWTLLAPWECILPIWYGLLHYPLSSGATPRFGCLDELRQIHFEHGQPWFPADYPGTQAGYTWERGEREKRKKGWEKRPKGKRVEWSSLDLGAGRKGEHGVGWALDLEFLVGQVSKSQEIEDIHQDLEMTTLKETTAIPKMQENAIPCIHLTKKSFTMLLSSPTTDLPPPSTIAAVRISLLTRGVVTPCARIYRLPTLVPASPSPCMLPSTLRQHWLSLVPIATKKKPLPSSKLVPERQLRRLPLDAPVSQRIRLIAQSLLRDPPLQYPPSEKDDMYPPVPDIHDLIGFVTTGAFNLADGKGSAIGSVAVRNVLEGSRSGSKHESCLCIVRNAGEKIGRLGKWEAI